MKKITATILLVFMITPVLAYAAAQMYHIIGTKYYVYGTPPNLTKVQKATYLDAVTISEVNVVITASQYLPVTTNEARDIVKELDKLVVCTPPAVLNQTTNKCEVPPPAVEYTSCANENGTCTIPYGKKAIVRYGTADVFIEKTDQVDSVTCTNEYFTDPAPGKLKGCSYSITGDAPKQEPTPTPDPSPQPTPPVVSQLEPPVLAVACGGMVETCTIPDGIIAKIWYGAGQKHWVTRSNVTGSFTCGNEFFGSDAGTPSYKRCSYVDMKLLEPVLDPQGKNLKPNPDMSNLPPDSTGLGILSKKAEPIPKSRSADPNAGGEFRIPCGFAKMLKDDPIVYPNVPGASHLHTFFGNVSINAYSTNDSLRNNGNGTCEGGIANRSGYWVPSLINMTTNKAVAPFDTVTYYKSLGYADAENMQVIPAGLRMIAGNANPLSMADVSVAKYYCQDQSLNDEAHNWGILWEGNHIQACGGAHQVLRMIVSFPNCWDGKNLDSPDHQSHMAYWCKNGECDLPNGEVGKTFNSCPVTHPIALPIITINADYKDLDPNAKYRLSSDNYSSAYPGGLSGHGDFMNGWDEAIFKRIIDNCMHKHMNCGGPNLGDGEMLTGFYN
jgi:hypothetical protein